HFLYNTLESVYLSLEARKEKESAEVVFSLSQLFKYTLKADDIVFLKDEVELLTKYLQIEKYRFGDKLIWNIFVEKGTESVKIPKLLIQPIVENAVKHGVEPSNTSTEIRVSISAYEKTLLINVYDSGNGMQSDELQKLIDHQKSKEQDNGTTSLGLKNVYDRLHN
ncbi:MAG TPA: sensor histidine kinase, partial [Bacteroidales bacterium]|nr:sensor histidine kinase [Bacteroidales bacterium]